MIRSQEDEVGGICSIYMGGMRSGYKIFIIKAEGKRPHGRLRHE
jgi:hypothetical protein